MRALTTVSLALFLLVALSPPASAGEKLRIEIVEATMTIGLVPHTDPGTPEQIHTDCNTVAGIHCDSTLTPATDLSNYLSPQVFFYQLKAIFPDGSHAELTCFPLRGNKRCRDVPSVAKDSGANADPVKCYMEAFAAFASKHDDSKETKTCTTRNLGVFSARRDKDEVVISTRKGKLEYRVTGSW